MNRLRPLLFGLCLVAAAAGGYYGWQAVDRPAAAAADETNSDIQDTALLTDENISDPVIDLLHSLSDRADNSTLSAEITDTPSDIDAEMTDIAAELNGL